VQPVKTDPPGRASISRAAVAYRIHESTVHGIAQRPFRFRVPESEAGKRAAHTYVLRAGCSVGNDEVAQAISSTRVRYEVLSGVGFADRRRSPRLTAAWSVSIASSSRPNALSLKALFLTASLTARYSLPGSSA
jgi:hypothetical protein